jgi:hypothetical protein
VVTLGPQWLHVRFWSPALPSLQTSRRDVGRTSSLESDLPQSITPGTDSDEDPPELEDSLGLEAPPGLEGSLGLEGPLGLADGLPPDELGELAAKEEGVELGVAEAPELVGWHAVTRADPRIAQTASDIWECRIMSPRTTQPFRRLRQNGTDVTE